MKQLNNWLTNEEARYRLEHCQSILEGTTAAGLLYDEQIASIDGAVYELYTTKDTTPEQIKEAKHIIRDNHDAIGFHTVKVIQQWIEEVMHKPDTAPDKGWIESMRQIVLEKQCRKIDVNGKIIAKTKTGGQLVDMFTASIMVQVYDKLNPVNRDKFHNQNFAVAHHIAMQLV